MKRSKFLLSTLASLPFLAMTKKLIRDRKGFFVAAGKTRLAETLQIKGMTFNAFDIKIAAADTDGDQLLIEQIGTSANKGPALHVHPHQDEYVYVLEGEYLFQVGDVKHSMKPGDTIFLPRGIQHAFVQLTPKARFLLSYQPAGKMEAFFTKMASLTKPPSPQEINQIFEDHDMKIVGGMVKI